MRELEVLVDLVSAAFKENDSLRLIFVGDGECKLQLHNLQQKLNQKTTRC